MQDISEIFFILSSDSIKKDHFLTKKKIILREPPLQRWEGLNGGQLCFFSVIIIKLL